MLKRQCASRHDTRLGLKAPPVLYVNCFKTLLTFSDAARTTAEGAVASRVASSGHSETDGSAGVMHRASAASKTSQVASAKVIISAAKASLVTHSDETGSHQQQLANAHACHVHMGILGALRHFPLWLSRMLRIR